MTKSPKSEFSIKEIIQIIRYLLPKAEVILSTWNYQDASEIKADKVIFSAYPGAMLFKSGSFKMHNLNRMLRSTQEGIRQATRKYWLKISSDIMPTKVDFLKIWQDLAITYKKYAIFNRQPLAYPSYSLLFEKKDKKIMPKPFHLSDWAFFGKTDDLRFLFDIPLVQKPEHSEYFIGNDQYGQRDTIPEIQWKYSPKQYLFYTAFCKEFYQEPTYIFISMRNLIMYYVKKNIYGSRIWNKLFS